MSARVVAVFAAVSLLLAARAAVAGECDEARPLPDEGAYYEWCRSCGGTPSGTLGTLRCDFGTGQGGGGGTRMSGGEVLLLAVVLVVAFPFVPAVLLEAASGPNAFGDPAHARWQWRAHRAEVEADEELGRRVERMRAELRIDPDEELRDAPAPKRPLVPFRPPRLQPAQQPLQFACDRAGIEFPHHPGGVIGGRFTDENDMLQQCVAHIGAPLPAQAMANNACQPGEFACVRNARCCPQSHPVYNECDQSCYRSADFRGSNNATARRCLTNEQCGVFQPR